MIDPDDVRAYFQQHNQRIRRWLRYSFRRQYGHMLSEAIQNAECLAFENVLMCAYRGKIATADDLEKIVKQSLYWSIRQHYAGRSVHDKGRKEDAVFGDVWYRMEMDEEASVYLHGFESTETDPADAAAFRCDLEHFMGTLSTRQRLIFVDL